MLSLHWKLPKTEISGKHPLTCEMFLNRSLVIQFKFTEDKLLQVFVRYTT